jgi:hypothetical protein
VLAVLGKLCDAALRTAARRFARWSEAAP